MKHTISGPAKADSSDDYSQIEVANEETRQERGHKWRQQAVANDAQWLKEWTATKKLYQSEIEKTYLSQMTPDNWNEETNRVFKTFFRLHAVWIRNQQK